MKVIPAIDLLDGQVVRLKKGSYEEVTVYNEHPKSQAREFHEAGFDHIHIVDLNGARDGQFANLPHIQSIVEELGMSVQVGGGIRSFESARYLLENGITRIVCSSMAVKNEAEWFQTLEHYSDRSILGLDLKEGQLAYEGWQKQSEEPVPQFLKRQMEHGLKQILSTDIERDGMLEGVNRGLYRELQSQFPDLDIIASGGVSGEEDLAGLQEEGIYGVVVGRAFYEGHLSLEQMRSYHDS